MGSNPDPSEATVNPQHPQHQQWQPAPSPSAPSRRPVIVAAVAGLVVVLAAVGVAAWVVVDRQSERVLRPEAAPAVQPSAAASTPAWDKATMHACEDAHAATEGDDPGYKRSRDAMGWAELSDVDTLREIADRNQLDGGNLDDIHAYTAALQISTWCLQHGIK